MTLNKVTFVQLLIKPSTLLIKSSTLTTKAIPIYKCCTFWLNKIIVDFYYYCSGNKFATPIDEKALKPL